jgi:hypothetical protein
LIFALTRVSLAKLTREGVRTYRDRPIRIEGPRLDHITLNRYAFMTTGSRIRGPKSSTPASHPQPSIPRSTIQTPWADRGSLRSIRAVQRRANGLKRKLILSIHPTRNERTTRKSYISLPLTGAGSTAQSCGMAAPLASPGDANS